MKKKFYLFLIIFICIFIIILIYKNKDNKLNGKIVNEERLSIMIKEEGASDYIKSSSKEIPKGDYVLNKEKTYCENNGDVVSYDSTLGSVSFSFIGSDRCTLYFDYKVKGWQTILLNNSNGATSVDDAKSYIEGKGSADFYYSATTNEGMYSARDNLGTSYYFRGEVDNNWVKFGKYSRDSIIYKGTSVGKQIRYYESSTDCNNEPDNLSCEEIKIASKGDDMYWRIVRINGDGSVRMIYSGTSAPTESTKINFDYQNSGNKNSVSIGGSAFNNINGASEYVGYMYTVGEQHGNSTDSTIKTYIDNWYKTTTLETDASTKNLVADSIFCNDRGMASGTWSSTGSDIKYNAYTRILSEGEPYPTLICENIDDRFTVDNINGNRALTYPVGLITVDEIIMAGNEANNDVNSSTFLYSYFYFWTMSPFAYSSSYGNASEYTLFSNLRGLIVEYDSLKVRPVINLSAYAKLSGDGTWNNVYTVS